MRLNELPISQVTFGIVKCSFAFRQPFSKHLYTMQILRNSTIQQETFNNYVAGAYWINQRDTI